MPKYATFLATTTCLGLLSTSLVAQEASDVVAKVGDTEITLGEMIITRVQLPPQYSQFPDDVLFEGILDQLIQQQLLADAAGEEPDRVTLALINERRSLMAGELVNRITQDAVTEEALQEAYAAATEGVELQTEWNASHLLVATEEEAAAAKVRVEEGEDFADVARDVSTGPTGPSGGLLGWFSSGMMVSEFETTVAAMEPGEVSDPFQTQFGWHIVRLNETRTQEMPGLEEMRGELAAKIREDAITARLDELEASVEIMRPEDGAFDPSILSNLDLLEPGE